MRSFAEWRDLAHRAARFGIVAGDSMFGGNFYDQPPAGRIVGSLEVELSGSAVYAFTLRRRHRAAGHIYSII